MTDVNYSEVDDDVLEEASKVASIISERTGEVVTATDLIDGLPNLGVDPTELKGEQVVAMREALDSDDLDEYESVLEDIGVEEPFRSQIIERLRADIETGLGSNDDGEDPASSGAEDVDSSEDGREMKGASSGGSVSKSEVRRMIKDEVPTASEIASQIKAQSGGGGGGGDSKTEQRELAMNLARMYLQSQGGGPPTEVQQAQEKMQERLVDSMAQRMASPSIGERIGHAIEQSLADEIASNISINIGGSEIDVSPSDEGESQKEAATDGGESDG